jgi:hypothetical protein
LLDRLKSNPQERKKSPAANDLFSLRTGHILAAVKGYASSVFSGQAIAPNNFLE